MAGSKAPQREPINRISFTTSACMRIGRLIIGSSGFHWFVLHHLNIIYLNIRVVRLPVLANFLL
jgi:hypothetical protein